MTDTISALTVILEKDIRSDEIEPLIEAIKQFRSVLDVETHVSNLEQRVANSRARVELGEKLFEILYPQKGST